MKRLTTNEETTNEETNYFNEETNLLLTYLLLTYVFDSIIPTDMRWRRSVVDEERLFW